MSNGAAQTAVGPMVVVAVDQFSDSPVVRDELAARLIPWDGRVAVACARWAPVRRALVSATEKQIPGLWSGMLCRKRYIDDVTVAAVRGGVEAVVVLGAGFDTRAHRLAAPAGVPAFEVDLPANTTRKRALVRRLSGNVPGGVTLVPVDFGSQDLGEVLVAHGYRRDRRTLFVWEAVTQYLDEESVRATFGYLAGAPSGSELAFTYVRRDFLAGVELYGGDVAYRRFVLKRRLWRFGLAPEEVGPFLAEYGWREVEQVGPREYAERYPEAGPASEIERCVRAVKS
ncbi:MAG: SAM-dependent methyltransferase [Saccharothrix sp.]|nr:SAM-dependent methyltransferase [Saccharothrix sp.]